MSLEKIGHYSLTNPASVYDEEALTALELAGRTVAKVNEAVGAFNTLETETGNHLQEQDKEISERLGAQDNAIKKMNDETMPAKVTEEVQEQIDNGTFDSQINTYIGNLEERVDNLLGSVKEGSTTLDAEVIDLRMAENGTTYTSAGECIRSEFTKVNDVLRIVPSWQPDKFVFYGDGREAELEGIYACTDFISIPETLETIGVITAMSNDSSGFCFYDVNKNYISGVNLGTSPIQFTENVVPVPKGARFIRYSCYSKNLDPSNSYLYFTDTLATLLTVEEETEEPLELSLVKSQYLDRTGSLITIENDNFVNAEMDVRPFQTFTLTSASVDNSRQYIIKSASGAILDMFPKENQAPYSVRTVTFTIPEGGAKLYLGGYMTGITIFEVINTALISERLDRMQEEINTITTDSSDFYKYAFEKILCIGDSLTAGACYVNGHTGGSISLNYPYYLGKMLNCNVTNAGRSGYSASDWHKQYFALYDFSMYDGFVIWLGTNYGYNSMPTDAEISSFTPDYTETADVANQSLYLIDIIKSIQSKNPDAVIFLCNNFASKTNTATNNTVLTEIAKKYSLPLVDMSDLGVSNHPELHGGVNNPHFGKAGNIYIANRIANNFADYFNADPLRVEFGY